MTRDASILCRTLAILAWITALGVFGAASIASWGLTPIAFLLWCVPAWPLFRMTLAWWKRAGIAVDEESLAAIRRSWRRFGWVAGGFSLLVFALLPLSDPPFFELAWIVVFVTVTHVYLAYPVVLTCWVIRRSVRRPMFQSV